MTRHAVLGLSVSLFAWVTCGCSDSAASSHKSDAVCFVLDGDWESIGAFQSEFVVGDSYMAGSRGFELHLSPDYLEILLLDEIDPASWIADLPVHIREDPVVKQVFPVSEGGCGSSLE